MFLRGYQKLLNEKVFFLVGALESYACFILRQKIFEFWFEWKAAGFVFQNSSNSGIFCFIHQPRRFQIFIFAFGFCLSPIPHHPYNLHNHRTRLTVHEYFKCTGSLKNVSNPILLVDPSLHHDSLSSPHNTIANT